MRRPLHRRSAFAAAAATALLACSGGKAPPPAASAAPGDTAAGGAPPAAPEQPSIDPAIEQFRPEDPAEVARHAAREEARGRFRTMKEAFAGGGRASSSAAARLQAALSRVPPPAGARWQIACRGAACRIAAAAAPEAWQPALLASADVQRVVDRLAADPDGRDGAAYALLAAEDAPPGDDLVGALARELAGSAEARACAANAEARGTIRYELRVDGSGFTYRADGDLPWPVVDCVNGVLGEIMRGIEVPPTARSATRTVALRL
ncbi:hypothetical protein [Anaeromyxobacter oryzae]|uniref:Lipoprotein n=1 Tax=Anaeromyxobacter oryzae TaxID=2918170 RepID=A0ABN6MSS1_9BACT|nr:hypothetical protein [Anaeromyxobacter oryzae]BDG04029.1 hypothetical protein AMOR_30250 [Anaeromyxobacter oryzae]